jgi:hypothetical protein
MTSILKADTIQDADGNNIINENSNTITIGASGDTTNIIGTLQNNGSAVGGVNTPAFQATMSGTQSMSDNTETKIQFDTEVFDTAGAYDHSSNYRFTPQTAGKYYVYSKVRLQSATSSQLKSAYNFIYKNGSASEQTYWLFWDSFIRSASPTASTVVEMNGSSDYLECYGLVDVNSGSVTGAVSGVFGAYKIIE